MLGSWYFLYTQHNWEYNEMYGNFYERAIHKFTVKRGYNVEKEKALEKYVAHIEEHLKIFDQK